MKKILLVEDNATNRDGLVRLLEKHGFEVITAEDGATAVSMALAEKPDLILMDIGIPIIDGFEATRLIRDAETKAGTPPVPIIALTAHAMFQDRVTAKDAGCTDFETKPIKRDRLFSKISEYLKS